MSSKPDTPNQRTLRSNSNASNTLNDVKRNQEESESNSTSNTQITLSDIKILIETSKNEVMKKFEQVITKQTEEIAMLSSRIEDLSRSNLQLKSQYKALEEKVSHLPATVLDEVEDRHRRRRNLVFSGVPEQTTGSVDNRKDKDTAFVEQILRELAFDDEKPLQVYRVGRSVPGKSRLLKVQFNDEEARQKVLRNARKLRDAPRLAGVYINPDLTVAQRHERRQLVEELKRRRNVGDDVMIFKGKIVSKSHDQNFH